MLAVFLTVKTYTGFYPFQTIKHESLLYIKCHLKLIKWHCILICFKIWIKRGPPRIHLRSLGSFQTPLPSLCRSPVFHPYQTFFG